MKSQLQLNQNRNNMRIELACRLYGFASLLVVTTAMILPRSLAFNGHTTCLFKHIFDYPCPSCGLTRSIFSFFHGDLSGSFFYNSLGPFLSFLFIIWSFDILLNSRSIWQKFLKVTQTSVVIMLVGVWIIEFVGNIN